MTTFQARHIPSFDGYSVAERILNDPESWRRESGRDWASSSDRRSDDDFHPVAGPSGGLRTGRRKSRPPSFTLRPFHQKFNLLPVNEPSPNPPSNLTTPNSAYKSPPSSAPESPFDIEKIYGLDLDDIYGTGEDDVDLPIAQSRPEWRGVQENEAFDRSKALARLLESSKTVSAEVTELVEQRLSLLLGQPNIFRAFATPQDLEFELEGMTPATGLATGNFVLSSPPSSYSTGGDGVANMTRMSLKNGLRISTTKMTTTVIAVKTPSTSSSMGVAIISAVSQTSAYSILDLYGTPKLSPDRIPKSAGLVPSPPNTSRVLVPKTSHPTTTTFSVIPSQSHSTPGSAFAAQFSEATSRLDTPKIVELPNKTSMREPPTLSIVTSVPSRLAYQKKATAKETAPLMVSKKGRSTASGKSSPRPLPKLPRSLTPPPAVPPLPSSISPVPIPPVPQLPAGPSEQVMKQVVVSESSRQPRRDARRRSIKATRSRSPPQRRSDETLPPLPETTPEELGESPSQVDVTVQPKDAPVVSKSEEDAEEKANQGDVRQPRSESRKKTGNLRSVTPPPRGSRPQKKKSSNLPVPPLPTPMPSPLPSTVSSTKEVVSTNGDVADAPPSYPTSTLSPLPASQPSGLSPASSAGSFPSPSAFPLPPPFVQSSSEQSEASTSVQDIPPATTDRVPVSPKGEQEEDKRASRKLSLVNKEESSVIAVEPPVIHVSSEVEEGPSTSDPVVEAPSEAPSNNEKKAGAQSEGSTGTHKRSKSRSPSLVVSAASVADIVEQAYANGIPPVDNESPELMLLRADSLKRHRDASHSPTSHGRSHSDVVGGKHKKTLRHSRSAVQLGSKASISNLASLFQRDVPLPDRSLLSQRTPGSSVDEGHFVADAFRKVDVPSRMKMPSPKTPRQGAGGEGLSSWRPPSGWGASPMTTQASSSATTPPERPQRAVSRIPSEILTMGASVIGQSLDVPSSSRPLSRSSSASATLTPSPIRAEKPISPSASVGQISRARSPVPSGNVLAVDVPPRRAVTPTPSAPPSRTHRRSVSEKLPESAVSSLAKRERRRAPTPTPAERRLLADLPPLPTVTSTTPGSSGRQQRAPTPPPLERQPVPSKDMPLPPLPTSMVSDMTSPRSTPSHSQKPSVDLPSNSNLPQLTSEASSYVKQEARRAVTPTGRSRSASVRVPVPPLPSALKPSKPAHSPSASIDHSLDDRLRRAPTPSGSRPPSDMPDVPLPDASVLARRMRKPSISAASRAEHTYSGVSTDSGYESSSSMKRFAQPTLSSSAKLKEPSASGSNASSLMSRSRVDVPPPVPPKAESRGRVRARADSPPRGSRGRSVPREERPTESRPHRDELRGRDRPSSPTRGRGRSVGRPDEDKRAAPVSLSARSRSVGPAHADATLKTRKRTSSLSVAPPPLPGSRLMVPGLSSRAPSPSGSMIRGRMSPFPVTTLASSLTAF